MSRQEIEQAIHTMHDSEIEMIARLLDVECRLRGIQIQWPAPRDFTRERVDTWLHEDALDAQALRARGP